MRYARFRSERGVRVFDEPDSVSLKERHRLDASSTGNLTRFPGAYDDPRVQPRYGGRGGRGGSGGSGSGVGAGRGGVGSGAQGRGTSGSPGRPSVTGMTVREHRERQRASVRRVLWIPTRAIVVVLLVVALAAAAAIVYWSPLLAVRDLRIEGTNRVAEAHLREVAALPEDSTLLRLDTEGIQSRLEAEPWIASVEIRRSFPSTVFLTVTEREPAAIVEIVPPEDETAVEKWLVSKDGVWLGLVDTQAASTGGEEGEEGAGDEDGEGAGENGAGDEENGGENGEGEGAGGEGDEGAGGAEGAQNDGQPGSAEGEGSDEREGNSSMFDGVRIDSTELAQLPPIKEVSPSLVPHVGEGISDEGVLNALAIVNGFSPTMLALVQSISAPDKVKTMIALTNNIDVAFGAAEDIEAKEQVIRGFLVTYEGRLTYINVRVANRATIRAIT